jgi:lysyl-tRNA synthetase class 2
MNEQEIIRRQKLAELKKLGIEPYPAATYTTTHNIAYIHANYVKETYDNQKLILADSDELDIYMEFDRVSIAGRIMSIQDMGKVSFAYIQDGTDKIQIYIKRDDICPNEDKTIYNTVWKRLIDIGDFIGINGYVFATKTGETTIHVTDFTLLSKSLKPLPITKEKDGEEFDKVKDIEFRYRHRYVDLVINPEVKTTFRKITTLKNAMRDYLNGLGALEVDTPVLQSIPGGASARPFMTHHNALDIPLYLRIANELYLKRLIVGGFDSVYEFSRNFRNEGMDRTHNPEFTVMEYYAAYKDYNWMMETTEKMLEYIAFQVNRDSCSYPCYDFTVDGKLIDFKGPYKRISIYDSIKEYTGIDISKMEHYELLDVCQKLNVKINQTDGKGKIIDSIFGEYCEHHYIQPTFIIDYPIEMSPLTKKHRTKEGLVERFELIVNGKELANAYSELNDPIDQRHRFEEQMELMGRGDDEAMYIDADFIEALEYGMPPTAGIGIGVDRLAMLMTGQSSIQDVLLFPQMRPKHEM